MRVLITCDFELWLNQADPQTNSGRKLIDKYKSLLLTESLSCSMVNEFLKEATSCLFDAGVHQLYDNVEEYIRENKISWRVACTIAHIEKGPNHLLEQYAVRILKSLTNLDENELILKIQQGVLKDIQYASGVRDIMAACNQDNPSVEYQSSHTVEVPHCCCESVDGSIYYFLEGILYKQKGQVIETSNDWNVLSESFKMVSWLLNQPICEYANGTFQVAIQGKTYIVTESDCKVVGNDIKTMSVDEIRESSRIQQLSRPNRELEYTMECVARLMEAMATNKICEMDHIKTYNTNQHRFTLLEGSDLLYADKNGVVNQPAETIIESIYKATGIELKDRYASYLGYNNDEGNTIKEDNERNEVVKRIEKLTEQYQNDPAKLAILTMLSKKLH